ncbi:MAG: hypothetical protein LIQ30_06565 [Planctomycetes bacterium]|nr:hypothetical protein [Planctomycetota bacterium]
MAITMFGLDFITADVREREAFSPTEPLRSAVMRHAVADSGVRGAVFLVTCNRSELYLSHDDDHFPDGPTIIATALGRDAAVATRLFTRRDDREAILHLMRVASGLESSVLGDDQIITQTRSALEAARDAGATDPVLETLFRSAVTAGKRVKTSVRFSREGASVAAAGIDTIAAAAGNLAGRRAIVIGNGVVGRQAAAYLENSGASVVMTVRAHRKDAGAGVVTVPFENRYAEMSGRDIVVSATSSPKYTVTAEDFARVAEPPPYLLDLAVPRDIDPAIATNGRATVWNVDDLRRDDDEANRPHLLEAEALIREEAKRFITWHQNRTRRLAREPGRPNFPLFINVSGTRVLVAGGGKIAARRAVALLRFDARVVVVSPGICPELERYLDSPNLVWERREYHSADLDGVTLAIAATDSREVNRRIGAEARERGVLVSVADRRDECTFYFPALIEGDLFTAGIISKNGDHTLVRKAAAEIREELDRIEKDIACGQPGEQAGDSASHNGYGRDTA